MIRWIVAIVHIIANRPEEVVEWSEDPIYHKDSNGNQMWTVNGKYHNLNGPALITLDTTEWWVNGQRHRVDGPAVENKNGTKCWYYRGARHCSTGPAMEFPWGVNYWYFHGTEVPCRTQQQFERLLKLKVFW